MRRRLPPLVLFIVCAFGAVAGAGQAEQGEGDVTVRAVTLRGVKAIDRTKLKEALATRGSARLPWGKKRLLDRRVLEADLQRIQAFYADRGYPDARATSTDLKFNARKTAVTVVVTVSEGEPVRVEAIEFNGFDGVPADHLETIRNDIPLRVGRPLDRALVIASQNMALNELRDHGFPSARVATTETVGADGKTATIAFTAETGVLASFGTVEINITGARSVGEHVVRRELDYKAGDQYRRSVIQNTQRRLYGLALFQFVNIEVSEPDPQSAEVSTKVTVVEGKHQRVNLGVGYGSEEKGRVDAEYNHLNFLGGARTGGVHGRYSSLDRGVRLNFNQPYFFGAHLSLPVEAQQWYTYTPAYQSVITGARVAVTHRSGPRLSWSVSVASERSSSSIAASVLDDRQLVNDLIALGLDPNTGKQEGTLSALGFDVQRSTTDHILNPTRGYQLALHAEEAGVLLPGTFNYYALAIDGRHYQPIGDDLVIATRLQLGNIDAAGASQTHVPFSKKYFLGGPTTLRGWGRYEVSPLSTSGLPLGGNSLLAFSAEARLTLRGRLGGVLFLDAGNVWADAGGFALNDLRYAIGPGLRYQTPVGPVRLDVGYQLNPIPGLVNNGAPQSSRLRFQFSIGEAF